MPNQFPPEYFRRSDERPDAQFYGASRFVTHIDDQAIAAVTHLYRDLLPAGGVILDLMSSWISHLPDEVSYARVVGLGMNQAELAANPRLARYDVHDLNSDPTLPYADGEYDACVICVSVDYLTQPVSVLRECARCTKPGGRIIITFSNRCFPSKAIAVWHSLDDHGRVGLVAGFLEATDLWANIECLDASPPLPADPLYAVTATRVYPG